MLSRIKRLVKTKITEKPLKLSTRQVNKLNKIINNYVHQSGIKINGLHAINSYIQAKDPKYKIYDAKKYVKYELLSPNATANIYELYSILKQEGFENLEHNKYQIFLDSNEIIEITDLPDNVFDEIGRNNYVSFEYVMVDLYDKYTNPMEIDYDLDKYYARGTLLEKLYPPIIYDIRNRKMTKPTPEVKAIIDKIIGKFAKNNNGVVLMGKYAYNYYMEEKIPVDKLLLKSANMTEDGKKLIRLIGKKHITVEKKAKFGDIRNRSVILKYKKIPIVEIIDVGKDSLVANVDVDNSVLVSTVENLIKNLYLEQIVGDKREAKIMLHKLDKKRVKRKELEYYNK
jgi:hypothetical protein